MNNSENTFTMKAEPFHIQESTKTTMNECTNTDNSHGGFSKRYLLAGILCMGIFASFSLNMNTSLLLIEMTNNRTVLINGTSFYEPEFNWNSEQKGLILSVFAYGHLLSFILPWTVKKFGGVTINGVTLLFSGIVNVLYPFIARLNFHFFLFVRILEGISEDIGFLSAYEIWSNWAPKEERSKLLSIQFTGDYVATAAVFPISGYLAYLWGWPAAYYYAGGLAIFISCLILSLFSNEPSTDKFISAKERKYLMREVEKATQEKVTYPWKEILTSVPLWALFVMQFSYVCGMTFSVLCLPHYVKDMTNMEIHNIGILSGIPNLLGIIAVPLCGWLADYLQNKKIITVTQVHKTYIFVGLVLSAGCIFVIALLGNTNFTVITIILVLFKVLLTFSDMVTKLAPMFLAPNHPSLVAALVSYSYFLGLFVIPTLVGYVVTSHDPYEWNIVLISLGAILLTGGLIFLFFGSSETQPWSRTKNEPADREENKDSLLP